MTTEFPTWREFTDRCERQIALCRRISAIMGWDAARVIRVLYNAVKEATERGLAEDREEVLRLTKQRDACVAEKYEARATLRKLIDALAPIVEHMERNADVDWSRLDRLTVNRALSAYYTAIARTEPQEHTP